ncbi:MAG: polyphosphate:AMP phosphotransferase [Lachnospiraceae bacterium]|nr:polyphosphate:AMP phosphotransferase [Lachnospiraceae bacterium]
MLEQIDLSKKISQQEFKKNIEPLANQLASLQRECRSRNIPVMIIFEGFSTSGKGTLINQLIEPLDPRGFSVYAINSESEEEKRRPFLWRFWTKTPENGRIAIFDRSWYRRVLVDRFEQTTPESQISDAYQEIVNFEQQLTDGGTVIIKFFLVITKKEQKKRMEKLLESKQTAWRVTDSDKKRQKHFKEYRVMAEEMLQKTDTAFAPWTIVEAMDKEYASIKIMSEVVSRLEKQITRKKENPDEASQKTNGNSDRNELKSSALSQADLSRSCSKEEYQERLKKLQSRLTLLHSALYRKKIPVILVFEGWDASGKGGAIRRLTQALDPRGYQVNPTSSPNDIEKAHHYLWRFWRNMPKTGHIAIFDRSWYGRVMVERIEGFCSTDEWKRAYREINDMEAHLAHSGSIILKFWMQIDKEEQERRFHERMENPQKQWKITDEDWRNRSKWDQYELAVDEMLIRTSTTYAPWIIVEGNNKYYARIKVLETVIRAMEDRLKSD